MRDKLHSSLIIQGFFGSIIKKHETVTDNTPMRINVNKIENRITFKITAEYYLKLKTPEKIKLLENFKESCKVRF